VSPRSSEQPLCPGQRSLIGRVYLCIYVTPCNVTFLCTTYPFCIWFGRIWLISSLVMVLDGPILALSDIMHTIAPSPATPVPQEEKFLRTESVTP
jgi:hypothetical protein